MTSRPRTRDDQPRPDGPPGLGERAEEERQTDELESIRDADEAARSRLGEFVRDERSER